MKKKLAFAFVTATMAVAMSSTAFASGRVLSNGVSGDDVYTLQQLLAYYGYFDEDPTGYFGDITENSLINFQSDYGLEVDGLAGSATCSFLGITTDDESDDSYSYTSLSDTLYYGMSGDEVYTLQVILSDYGYFDSAATGFFGDLTEAAVMDFQSDYGLDVDGVVGSETIGMLTGTYTESSYYDSVDMADYQAAVLAAIDRTPATSAGYCAEWVTEVFQNAGILTYNINNLRSSYYSYAVTSGLADSCYSGNTGFNANDYWAYVCYSNDISELEPGMIVATRSSYTYLGRQFGHVGIYIGNGQIISCVGYLEILSFDEWNAKYNNTEAGSSIYWGYLPY